MTKHWHAINGTCGCLPDNNEVHPTKESAARSLANLFEETRGVYTDLMRYQYCDKALMGAEYCEINLCYEQDCSDYNR